MESLAHHPQPLEVAALTRPAFHALEPEWPALLARTGHEAPFYRFEFLRAWLDAFAPQAELHLVVARDGQGLRAALPLLASRERLYGLPVRKLAGTANVHSSRFDLLASPQDEQALAAIWAFVRDQLEWDLLELPDVPASERAEGAARRLLALAEGEGLPTGAWESMRTPFIPLGAPLEQVLAGTTAKFRANLRRRRRKLAEQGPLRLERYAGGPELAARLKEGLALEASGWKGQAGTAIAADPAARAFYERLAQQAAAQGYLALYFLRVGERPVAFHLGLHHQERYYLPKCGFDEAAGACSPGQLLVEDVLGDLCGRSAREFDFLGPNMPWKQDWTERERPHHWLYAFRDSMTGRALWAAKFKLAPAVKEVLPWKP